MNVELLRSICLSLRGATEDIKWEHDLAFCIGGKMFCVTSFDLPFRCTMKVEDHQFEELISQPGFAPAPYLARAKWVQFSADSGLSQEQWTQFVTTSYGLIAKKLTKKQRSEIGL